MKPHNHNSAQKETNRVRSHSVGDAQHLHSFPKTWSKGLQFILHDFLWLVFLLLFLHQIFCAGIVTQEARRTETKLYSSQTHKPTQKENSEICGTKGLCQQSTLLLLTAISSCKGEARVVTPTKATHTAYKPLKRLGERSEPLDSKTHHRFLVEVWEATIIFSYAIFSKTIPLSVKEIGLLNFGL